MYTLDNLFDTFLEEIEPDKKARKYAKRAHKKLRNHLEKQDDFKEYVENIFLYGSYKRHTAINTIKDVDIVIETNFDISLQENDPKSVLKKLKAALVRLYKDADNPEYQRRSIKVKDPLPEANDSDLTLDVIPAVRAGSILKVPDRVLEQWVDTNPEGHITYISTLNKNCNKRLVPLIKALKHWWEFNGKGAKPKGFWLECLVAETFDNSKQTYAEHILAVFQNISNKFLGFENFQTVPLLSDPGISGETLKTSMTLEEFKSFMECINKSKEKASSALASDNEQDASSYWNEILGDEFPIIEDPQQASKSFSDYSVSLGRSDHMKPLQYPFQDLYRVSIDAYLYRKTPKLKSMGGINSNGRTLLEGVYIKYIAKTNAREKVNVLWQVVNTGDHAEKEKGLRGDFFEGHYSNGKLTANPFINWEHTEYTGKHWIQCFLINENDVCVGKSEKFYVNIKNSKI